MRGRAAPRKLLVVRGESLARFFQRVGLILYDTDWRYDIAYKFAPLEDTRIGSDEEMSALVREQILSAIIGGKVDVRPLFSVIGLPERKAEEPDEFAKIGDEIQQIGRGRPRPAVDEDDTDDTLPDWRLDASFWNTDPQIDWRESKADVEARNILDACTGRSPADLYEMPSHPIVVNLRVYDPDKSIRAMMSFDDVPDGAWITKYNDYVGVVLRESIAVAWRHAAINGLGSEDTINQKLISVISDYLQARDMPAPDGTIKNIVGKMVKQWKTRDMLGRIFVNSSRDKRRLQGKVAAAMPARET